MRRAMSSEAEATLKNCNSIAKLRKAGEFFKEDVAKSLESNITHLSDVICCLELKGKKFKVYGSSSKWDVLPLIEPFLTSSDKRRHEK